MAKVIVLFNLKDGVDRSEYEAWARTSDLPIVRGLDSVADFSVHRVSGLLGSDDASPYQYIEIIDVSDMARFGEEVASETVQKQATEFQGFADGPLFLLTESLD
jgi:hypothetical protein